MDGPPRTSTARRVRVRTRAALVGVLALVALLAVPGTAAAGGTRTVKPVLDCYVENGDGSWTVVVGYVNSSRESVDIPRGPDNQAHPSTFASLPPTTFRPGTVKGALTAEVSVADLYAGARWVLDGYTLDYRAAASSSRTCPSSTELPAQGNGLAPAIGLAVAGVAGAVLVRRARARAAEGGRDDA
jgi:hypothetical protein